MGFPILDISNILLYEFHYDLVKANYPRERSQLFFKNTYSLIISLAYFVSSSIVYNFWLASANWMFSGLWHLLLVVPK